MEHLTRVLDEFVSDNKKGIKRKRWSVIPKEQYHNLLNRYMDDPIKARIPDSVIDEWLGIIRRNTETIEVIGYIWPRGEINIPVVELNKYFKTSLDKVSMREKLINMGFFRWARYPDGKFAYSDRGLDTLKSILDEETPDMPAEDKLLLINRCLNVVHPRNDLSLAFIEGGSETCSEISGQNHENLHKT